MIFSAISQIRCTPFCEVTRPTNEKTGIESSKSPKLKYFICSFLFALKWSGAAASKAFNLSLMGIPFGKANGRGFYLSKYAREEPCKSSSLYDLLTVAH